MTAAAVRWPFSVAKKEPLMTFKQVIDETNSANAVRAEREEGENTKKAELGAIADRLEQHLSEQNPFRSAFDWNAVDIE